MNKVIHGDCLEVMKEIPDKSIDMILCDLPYGTTGCKWDKKISLELLWIQYNRIIKTNKMIVLTASQPFTSRLVFSNLEKFKYSWIWNKKLAGNGILAKKQPLKIHEDILVFNGNQYNPIMKKGKLRKKNGIINKYGTWSDSKQVINDMYYPVSILEFYLNRNNKLHLTQKPVELFEYLIKTYSNEGDLVLDNCAGSGTTAIACINTKRNYILIEKEKEYIDIINKRITGTEKCLS